MKNRFSYVTRINKDMNKTTNNPYSYFIFFYFLQINVIKPFYYEKKEGGLME